MEKYFRLYGCCGTNVLAMLYCTNQKTEIPIEIIETQVTGIKIYFVIKKILLFIQTCLFRN